MATFAPLKFLELMPPITEKKRRRFQQYVDQVLREDTAVTGSVTSGKMTHQSDIDAVIFLNPFDPLVVLVEAILDPVSDIFHTGARQCKAT